MSTVKAINFQHPDAASPAITLDASGDVTIPSLPSAPNIQFGSGTTTAFDTTTVTFLEAFDTAPAVVASGGLSNGSAASVVVHSVTTTGFKIIIFDEVPGTTNNAIAAPFSWIAVSA